MRKIIVIIGIAVLLCAVSTASAVPYNVVFNKNVTLYGEFFTGGWSGGDVPSNQQGRANTLADGYFFQRSHRWDQGTVWWDAEGLEQLTTQ